MKKAMTLIEFLFVLLIITMLAIFACYQFNGLQRKKAETTMHQLQQLAIFAQLKAIVLNTNITLCPLDSKGQCMNNWQAPIAIFIDKNKKHVLTSKYFLLKTYKSRETESGQLTLHAFASNRYLTFTSLGLSGQQNGTFTYCDTFGYEKIRLGLSISKSGRTKILFDSDKYFKDKALC